MKKSLREMVNVYITAIVFLVFVIGVGSFYFISKGAFENTEKRELKNAVEMIIALISEKEKDVLNGLKTRNQAQDEVIDLLSNSQFLNLGKHGYPVIIDYEGILLVHPELRGQYALDLKDYSKEPAFFVREQVKMADQGGGFTYFEWIIPDTEKIDKKIVYSKRDPVWNWIVEATSFELDYGLSARNITTYGLIVFFILSFVIIIINRKFIKQILLPLDALLNAFTTNSANFGQLKTASNIKEFDVMFYGFNEMINRLKIIQLKLEDERLRYKKVVKSSYDSYWEYDFDRDVINVENYKNSKTIQEFEYQKFIESIYIEDLKNNEWLQPLRSENFLGTYETSIRIYDEQENLKWYRLLAIFDIDGHSNTKILYGSLKDINDIMLEKSKTEYRAYHDPKTGLFNLDYFSSKLFSNQDDYYHFALVGFRNLNHLKLVYGSDIVGLFLFQLAGILSEIYASRAEVCVYDDNRFLIVSKDVIFDEISYRNLISKVKSLKFADIHFPKELIISLSYDQVGNHKIQTILNNLLVAYDYNQNNLSDSVMNSVDADLLEAYERKKEIERNLLNAIDYNEMYLVYQPIFNYQYQLLGFEVLLRWQNRSLGFVSPAEFIPIAESIQYISNLGKFVITSACRMLKRLNEMDCTTTISLNASVKELIRSDYVLFLLKMCKEYTVSPKQIKIEVTESSYTEFYSELSLTIAALNAQGFEVHMDDFGTGYSSLNQFGNLNISVLKIDKSFIDKIKNEDKMASLTKMIIEIAHKFGIQTVAEGIEDEMVFNLLNQWGCDYYQGYYLSKPMNEVSVVEFMSQKYKQTAHH